MGQLETRLYWSSRVRNYIQSKQCFASLLCRSNRIDGILCALQHLQASYEAVPKMDHDLERRLRKETCVREKSKCMRTFKAFEANIICKLPRSQSLGGRHGTNSAETSSIPRCCNIYGESSSRTRVLFNSLPRRIEFCSSNQRWSVSEDGSLLCTARRCRPVGYGNPINSRGSNVFPK